MLNVVEKKIIKLLKEKGIEKDIIIPTMLIIKDIEDYQIKLLNYLENIIELDEEMLMEATERLGLLENNSNVL